MGFSRQEYWSGVPLPSPEEPDTILKNDPGGIRNILISSFVFEQKHSHLAQHVREETRRNKHTQGSEPGVGWREELLLVHVCACCVASVASASV